MLFIPCHTADKLSQNLKPVLSTLGPKLLIQYGVVVKSNSSEAMMDLSVCLSTSQGNPLSGGD